MTWLVGTSSAHACGATPAPYLTVSAILDGQTDLTLPRDAAVLVTLKSWPALGDSDSPNSPSVTVRNQRTGDMVAGSFTRWYAGAADTYVWSAREPLAANTQFQIEVVTTSEPRNDIDAPIMMRADFRTSDALSPPLELVGALQASLRVGTAEYTQCAVTNDCGGGSDCKTLSRPALYADVTLPVVSGGYDALDYVGVLATSDAARSFAAPGEGVRTGETLFDSLDYQMLRAGSVHSVSVELYAEGVPYTPCFSLNVWDSAQHWHSPTALCLPSVDVEARLGLAADGGGPAASAHGGCSVAGGGGRAFSRGWWLALCPLGIVRCAKRTARGRADGGKELHGHQRHRTHHLDCQ
jgi:hypothetical protein